MNNNDRKIEAKRFREDAANLAFEREHPDHVANGDEQKFASAKYMMSFTKGLDHDPATGLIKDRRHFEAFRQAIDNGVVEPFTTRVPVPTAQDRRMWEAPTAGVVFDLEGPDAQAVTMPPAPPLCSDELTFEMAEVYELALLRDVPLTQFDGKGPSPKLTDSITRLNAMEYAQDGFQGRPRKTGANGKLTPQTVFRGSSPGSDVGPYVSQFLLMGNADRTGTLSVEDGKVLYGAQVIDQRVPMAPELDDYMVDFTDYIEVQQGYGPAAAPPGGQNLAGQPYRFIHTPRDLATYVHFDALYQAYLNACLILLSGRGPGMATPFDPAFNNLSGPGSFEVLTNAATGDTKQTNAGGFALYGGPHILTLVTEVATRALKAVRFQKFNTHIRLRPEALAARLDKAKEIEKAHPEVCGCLSDTFKGLKDTAEAINKHNQSIPAPRKSADTYLLPMAFAEGSPMHPAYGAGHATVAGACVTILKAFFDTSAMLAEVNGQVGWFTAEQLGPKPKFIQFETTDDGKKLAKKKAKCPLTLEGELNKLAANISIGRNMAGVHYFTDYFDSARMGEEIAIGLLEEQAIGYPTDPFVMSVPTFDGGVERIGAR
ncbi:MAG: vanadium-dependent haloperoxidase [Pseudomonadota bacterium]